MSKHTRIIYVLLVLATLLAAGETKAQSEETDFQNWTDFTFTYIIKNRTNIGADFGVRGMVSKNDWNQFYFRPTYQYFFNRTMQAGGGIAIFAR